MEPITGDEVKLRIWELPQGQRTVVPYDTMFYGDGPLSGPNFYEPQDIISSSVKRITARDGPPPFDSKILVIPPGDGSAHLYDLALSTGAATDYYLGPSATNPTQDHQGQAIVPGHSYFNTTDNQTYNYTSAGQWVLAAQPIPSSIRIYVYHILVDTTFVPAVDDYGRALDFDTTKGDAVTLYLNGARQVGGIDFILHPDKTITLPIAMQAGNILEIQVLGRPVVAWAGVPYVIDTTLWAFNGVTRAFDLRTVGGQLVVPGSPASVLCAINGLIQSPVSDFAVSGSTITFTSPPPTASPVWATVSTTDPQRRGVVTTNSASGVSLTGAHNGFLIEYSAAATQHLPDDPTTLGAGWMCEFAAPAAASVIIDGPGATNLTITAGNVGHVRVVGGAYRGNMITCIAL